MDYWQPFLVVNLCHSLIEYYTISNGKWIWLLRYMTKIHQNERKKVHLLTSRIKPSVPFTTLPCKHVCPGVCWNDYVNALLASVWR